MEFGARGYEHFSKTCRKGTYDGFSIIILELGLLFLKPWRLFLELIFSYFGVLISYYISCNLGGSWYTLLNLLTMWHLYYIYLSMWKIWQYVRLIKFYLACSHKVRITHFCVQSKNKVFIISWSNMDVITWKFMILYIYIYILMFEMLFICLYYKFSSIAIITRNRY